MAVRCSQASGTAHFILDVNGYFQGPATGLVFGVPVRSPDPRRHPVRRCRAARPSPRSRARLRPRWPQVTPPLQGLQPQHGRRSVVVGHESGTARGRRACSAVRCLIIIHSMNNLQRLPRLLAPPLAKALRSFPVVVLGGSRQTGKSTLARLGGVGRGRAYLSLDDIDVLDRARRAPEALVRDAARLTLDEVQRAPELLLAVKREVDEDRRPGRFLLTGSANLLLMRRVSETLAGRAVHLTLRPLTRLELLGCGSAGAWGDLCRRRDRAWPALLRPRDAARRRLARCRAPRRISDAGPPPAPRRRARALARRLHADLPRARPTRPQRRSTRCPTSAA